MKPRVWHVRDLNKPEGTIYVGRPTRWGNPFKMQSEKDRAAVIRDFEEWIMSNGKQQILLRATARLMLRGKHLSCWCAPKPCHADVWLRIANGKVE